MEQVNTARRAGESGVTLIELIIVVTILGILASAAVPLLRFQVKREKEHELRADLWEMRRAIDAYKDAADLGGIQVKADSNGYPPDLDTLVNGVDIQDKHVRFLRAIPEDPMTKSKDWGLRSNQDDPDSDTFGGQNVWGDGSDKGNAKKCGKAAAESRRTRLYADRADYRDDDHQLADGDCHPQLSELRAQGARGRAEGRPAHDAVGDRQLYGG
jgi:general secretion pathway protein G